MGLCTCLPEVGLCLYPMHARGTYPLGYIYTHTSRLRASYIYIYIYISNVVGRISTTRAGTATLNRHFPFWHLSSNWGRTGMPVGSYIYKYTHIISNMHGSLQNLHHRWHCRVLMCMTCLFFMAPVKHVVGRIGTTRAGTATSMAESAICRNGHIITRSWLNRP